MQHPTRRAGEWGPRRGGRLAGRWTATAAACSSTRAACRLNSWWYSLRAAFICQMLPAVGVPLALRAAFNSTLPAATCLSLSADASHLLGVTCGCLCLLLQSWLALRGVGGMELIWIERQLHCRRARAGSCLHQQLPPAYVPVGAAAAPARSPLSRCRALPPKRPACPPPSPPSAPVPRWRDRQAARSLPRQCCASRLLRQWRALWRWLAAFLRCPGRRSWC